MKFYILIDVETLQNRLPDRLDYIFTSQNYERDDSNWYKLTKRQKGLQ